MDPLDTKTLEHGVTHPQIHIDYYEWIRNLSVFNKKFIADQMQKQNADGLLMFAFSMSRELLKDKAKRNYEEKNDGLIP